MKKNEDLFDLADVCGFFGLTESTVRRRVQESRSGRGSFPLPLFRPNHRLLWRRADIVDWCGEVAPQTPPEPTQSLVPFSESGE